MVRVLFRIVGFFAVCVLVLCIAVLFLMRSEIEFAIAAPGAKEAEVLLCNDNPRLETVDGGFRDTVTLRCSTSGVILVTYGDGVIVPCRIPYVTPGLGPKRLSFTVETNHQRCIESGRGS